MKSNEAKKSSWTRNRVFQSWSSSTTMWRISMFGENTALVDDDKSKILYNQRPIPHVLSIWQTENFLIFELCNIFVEITALQTGLLNDGYICVLRWKG